MVPHWESHSLDNMDVNWQNAVSTRLLNTNGNKQHESWMEQNPAVLILAILFLQAGLKNFKKKMGKKTPGVTFSVHLSSDLSMSTVVECHLLQSRTPYRLVIYII